MKTKKTKDAKKEILNFIKNFYNLSKKTDFILLSLCFFL